MKIAFVIERFNPALGGVEVYAQQLARALLARGQEVHVFTSDPGPPEEGVVVRPVAPALIKPRRHYVFGHRGPAAVPKGEFDIVHGFGRMVGVDLLQLHGGVHRAWMRQEMRSAQTFAERLPVWIKHAANLRQYYNLRLEAEQFRDPRIRFMAISHMVRRNAMDLYGVPDDRIGVVYNGADIERFHPRHREAHREALRARLGLRDEMMLLFVGHNFKRKGLRPALRALAHLKDARPPARLVVVGGDSPRRYASETARLGVEHMVRYVGRTREIEKYYAAADALVFPTYYDPCAMVAIEALASGLPVITSTFNGSGELITPGREGYLVDPDDAQGIAQAVRALLPTEAREAAGRAARAAAEAHSQERHVREVMDFYALIAEQKRRR